MSSHHCDNDDDNDDDERVQRMRKELELLRKLGDTKRRVNLGEEQRYQEVKHHLTKEWRKLMKKQQLHNYSQALRDSQTPSRVLQLQAKLCFCLHSREISQQQQRLVEHQNRNYCDLLGYQIAQQQDECSIIMVQLMNDLCSVESEIKELQHNMKEMGLDIPQNCILLEQGKQEGTNEPNGTKSSDPSKESNHSSEAKNLWAWLFANETIKCVDHGRSNNTITTKDEPGVHKVHDDDNETTENGMKETETTPTELEESSSSADQGEKKPGHLWAWLAKETRDISNTNYTVDAKSEVSSVLSPLWWPDKKTNHNNDKTFSTVSDHDDDSQTSDGACAAEDVVSRPWRNDVNDNVDGEPVKDDSQHSTHGNGS